MKKLIALLNQEKNNLHKEGENDIYIFNILTYGLRFLFKTSIFIFILSGLLQFHNHYNNIEDNTFNDLLITFNSYLIPLIGIGILITFITSLFYLLIEYGYIDINIKKDK